MVIIKAFGHNFLSTPRDQGLDVVLPMELSKNQLNQKLKLMIEAPEYVTYSNIPPTREPIGLELWMRHRPS